MEEKLCGTNITGNLVQSCLRERFGPQITLDRIETEIFGVNEGFTSRLMKTRLTWSEDSLKAFPNELPSRVVLKTSFPEAGESMLQHMGVDVQSLEPEIQQGLLNAAELQHQNECNVYNYLTSQCPIPLVKCYAAVPAKENVHSGLIVMEDLSDRAAVISDIGSGLNYAQCMAGVTALVDLHAWCLTTDVPWEKQFFRLEERKELVDTVLYVGALRPSLHLVKETYEQFASIDIDKIMEYLDLDPYIAEMNTHRGRMKDVLVHSDFWANNLLFELQSPQDAGAKSKVSDRLLAIIDWQTAHKGSCTTDLCRLVMNSSLVLPTMDDIRGVFQFYYSRLVEKAGQDRIKMSFQEMSKMFERQFAVTAIFFMAHLPFAFTLISGEDSEIVMEKFSTLLQVFHRNYQFAVEILGLPN